MKHSISSSPLHLSRGFSLLEALIAMVVLSFGMLALAGFQARLTGASDVAKQRGEAVRLAQMKAEELRGYGTIASTAGYVAWNNIAASGSQAASVPSNTAYNMQWAVSGTADEWQRTFWVAVSWTDRASQPQTVRIDSVISQSDPAAVGSLNLPTVENGILRRPRGRDINIPIPATALGGANTGRSTIGWNGQWLVFSNDTGNVVFLCEDQPTDSTDLAASCDPTEAYLLSGFISGDVANSNSSSNYMNLARGTDSADQTTFGTIAGGLTITWTSTANMVDSPSCVVGNARDQNTNAIISGYIAYACLVYPADHDSNSSTPRRWSGRTNIAPAPTGSARVCRYGSGATNAQHPETYTHVTESLDGQNFALIRSGSCPAGSVTHQ